MKNIFLILLSSLFLFGCSKRTVPAVDLVKAGKDIVWNESDGSTNVLHVDSRNGDSLEGIRVVHTGKDGSVAVIMTADSGKVYAYPTKDKIEGVLYTNFAKIALENVQAKYADGTVKEYKDAYFFMHP
jgi:hypothetical protein